MRETDLPAAIAGGPIAKPARDHRGLALAVLLVGAILPPLDYFIVNLALPAIHAGLHASEAQLQLIISAYASANAAFLITGGRLGDLYGRKRIFMLGMAGFVLASALCGFANSGSVLVAGRMLQGLFASILAPQVLATIRSVFTPQEQVRVMGFYGFVFGLAAVIGQLGGGALISLHPFGLGWRAIFLVNLPIGALALLGSWRFIPENRPAQGARLDLPGVLLLSLCLLLVIYPLTRGREQGWPAWTLLSLAASLPALGLLVWAERRCRRLGGTPLLDLTLFRRPAFSLGLLLALLLYFQSAFFLTYGIYLQGGLGWSALDAGLAIMPYALGFLLGPLATPRLARRLGGLVLTAGFAALAAGLALSLVHAGTAPGRNFHLGLALAGIGQGLVLPSVVRMVLAEVEPAQAGIASGMTTATLQIGAAIGSAVIGGIFFSVLGAHPAPAGYAHAFRVTLGVLSLLFVACTLLSLPMAWLHRRHLVQAGAATVLRGG